MAEPKRMFFDDLTDKYSGCLRDFREEYGDFVRSGTVSPGFIEDGESFYRDMLRLLNGSKIFLLNGAVVDDMYHFPHDNTNYQASMHMPFPLIFFELMDPLEIHVDNDKVKNVGGILSGKLMDMTTGSAKATIQEDQFRTYLLYNEAERFSASDFVEFRLSRLPEIRLKTGNYFYQYSPGSVVAIPEPVKDFLVRTGVPDNVYETLRPKNPQIASEVFGKLLDLSINVVDYINAHNVTIRREDRETRDIDRINRDRLKRGKNPLRKLKPYYWVDVQQSELTERNGKGHGLDYREWVRGHFTRYHTRNGVVKNWIKPYIRGPDDAPWKENRYRVLSDMLEKGPKL